MKPQQQRHKVCLRRLRFSLFLTGEGRFCELVAAILIARCVFLHSFLGVIGAAALMAALVGCHRATVPAPTPAPAAWFQDVTAQEGIHFIQNPGPADHYFFPEIIGSGAALLDYDNDGRLDLYLLQCAGPSSGVVNRLYHQEADGRFRDVTAGSGLGIAGYNSGAAVGDVNNDGLPDVLVCGYGGVRLFLNNGNGTFRDVTHQSGLDDPNWAVSASFFDPDRDGRLDLVIVSYVDYAPKPCPDPSGRPDYCAPAGFPGTVSHLYHNLGPLPGDSKSVHFADVTVASGLARANGPGLGVSTLDFSGDGWPDILITQDGRPNRLWINGHDGTFKDEALIRGLAVNNSGVAQANMGIALGDLDGSGLPSVYVTHLTEEGNTLWAQTSPGVFEDRTAAAGLAAGRRGTGFGTVMADFTNSGSLDLALVNGRVRHMEYGADPSQPVAGLGAHWLPYAERNQLLANDGHGKFRDISDDNPALCGAPNVGRGLACGDIWNDGGMDMVVTSIAGSVRLLRDVAPQRGHWLEARAVDPRWGGRDAYGARVMIEAGGQRQVNWVNPAYSIACSNDPRAHFGLGQSARADKLSVLWPDGKNETFPACAADQVITLRRGSGKTESKTE